MKIKLGLDLHGVIDAVPFFFSIITNLLVKDGHEVHIITGQEYSKKLEEELQEKGVVYTHIFSISTFLIKQGKDVQWDKKNTPWFDEREWRKAKGNYCAEKGINLHLDDSAMYDRYFTTPYAQFIVKKI